MTWKSSIVEQCGTVTVNVAPLLLIIGVAMQNEGPDLDGWLEMLDVESEPETVNY